MVKLTCLNCSKCFEKSQNGYKFCCKSCAATFNNKIRNFNPKEDKRTKTSACVDCGKEIEVNIRADLKKCKCDDCHKIKRLNNNLKSFHSKDDIIYIKRETGKVSIVVRTCKVCGNIFETHGVTDHCSKECRNYTHSINRSKKIQELGTNNWKTKRSLFNYKNVSLECDSKLEEAAIIYLKDIIGVESVERYKNILNFWEGNQHRTFNPDFFCIKDNSVIIVEVKMKWLDYNKHDYNRNIPLKKESLQNFCDEKKYRLVWLDFDFDKKFEIIYRKHLNLK